jgi:hypothetical protein
MSKKLEQIQSDEGVAGARVRKEIHRASRIGHKLQQERFTGKTPVVKSVSETIEEASGGRRYSRSGPILGEE